MSSKAPGVLHGWIAHIGAPGNRSYQLYLRKPTIRAWRVRGGDGSMVTLYHAGDKWIWNFCTTGFGMALRLDDLLPLGSCAPCSMTVDLSQVEPPPEVTPSDFID